MAKAVRGLDGARKHAEGGGIAAGSARAKPKMPDGMVLGSHAVGPPEHLPWAPSESSAKRARKAPTLQGTKPLVLPSMSQAVKPEKRTYNHLHAS